MSSEAYAPSDDWRYPSPSSTPHSDKLNAFVFNDTTLPSSRPFVSDSFQLASPADQSSSPGRQSGATDQGGTMAARLPGQTAKQKKRAGTAQLQAQAGQSLTDSFIGKFDGASISDSTSVWQVPDQDQDQDQDQAQMQTPPPTRDTSVKRRTQQQPAFNFATPSTIKSRRHSTLGDEWLRRGPDALPLEASPLHFTPLQFSPPDLQGPMTAPVHTDTAILWDPDSHNPLLTSFSTTNEDPFFSSSPIMSEQWPSAQIQSRFKNALSRDETLVRRRNLGAGPARKGTSRLIMPSSSATNNTLQTSAGVNPSMLWSSQGSDDGQLKISDPPSALVQGRDVQQPYQYQFEERKREKDLLRQGKVPPGLFKANHKQPLSTSSTMPSLRRSLTDSKARMSFHEGLFSRSEDRRDSFPAVPVPRHSSPLKRQRTGTTSEQASPSVRKSVSLTVDEQGRARTVITPIGGGSGSPRGLRVRDESDSSDDLFAERQGESTVLADGSSRNDAQDALREVMKQRQQRKQDAEPRSSKKQGPTDSFALSDVSPTMTQESMPHLALASDLNDKIQCLCLGGAANAYMIECDSCKKWSHLECLGLSPDQAPRVFMCMFCREQLQAATGPAGGQQPSGASYAAPLYDPKFFIG